MIIWFREVFFVKKVAILQSNYIPWKGYFDMIRMVDEFILYDDMQYTRRDWRNRNKIKTANGLQWLTIPVESKGNFYQKINETKVSGHDWIDKHWHAITLNYAHAPAFKEYGPQIQEIYEKCRNEEYLSRINYLFLTEICRMLGIATKITWSSDYQLVDGKTERLVGLVRDSGGTEYLSGPAAQDYIAEDCFRDAGIKLTWMDYSDYPEYPQLFGEFEHNVSILDLLFNMGDQAVQYMKPL